jgi:hypothetical protein
MRTLGIIVGVVVLLVLGAFARVFLPGTSGVIASISLPDGSEYMVTQKCTWSPEPYIVSFYMRSPGGKWGWCYIDHQAIRWRNVAMSYDTNKVVVTITERGAWQAALDRKRVAFAIGDGKPRRELAAPQSYQEPEFPFPQ